MITNTLLLKLKDRTKDNIAKTRNILLSMRGKIPYLRDIQVETNIRSGPMSYDLILVGKFDSMRDFEAYLTDPIHVETAKHIGDVLETGAAVCYES